MFIPFPRSQEDQGPGAKCQLLKISPFFIFCSLIGPNLNNSSVIGLNLQGTSFNWLTLAPGPWRSWDLRNDEVWLQCSTCLWLILSLSGALPRAAVREELLDGRPDSEVSLLEIIVLKFWLTTFIFSLSLILLSFNAWLATRPFSLIYRHPASNGK